jgi:exodeoxyribonuclease VII large subunit
MFMLDTCTVAELTTYIRELFDSNEQLQDVWVEGEVSNLTKASSGHLYFTLKDSSAQIKCVMWRSSVEKQQSVPQNGDAVLVHGAVSVYEVNGVYQLYADRIRPLGVGNLYQQFEALKARLSAEGLFDEARKRPIPTFPVQIGIVTSAEAAAFQDVQNVLRRRYPVVEVILSSCQVQGDGAPAQIVAAIERLNQHSQADVILLCRGGGSIEDLWAFNDERVARAIVASRIPVVSGVGHETDFTIADFAADLRAPTPSAAAELLTPNVDDLRDDVDRLQRELIGVMSDQLQRKQVGLSEMLWALRQLSPEGQMRQYRQRLDDWNARLVRLERGRLALLRERLAARLTALNAASPQAILERGYAIVTISETGERVISAEEKNAPKPGVGITVRFRDGEVKARVEDKDTHERYKRTLF